MHVPSYWDELAEVESTQKWASIRLLDGAPVGVVFARHQNAGRGRFGRPWVSKPGESLTMSLVFDAYAGHPRPWLVGMATACACAEVLDCRLRWPNDLGLDGRKIGGILTELLPDRIGRVVPVVGVGINLGTVDFPEDLQDKATSVFLSSGVRHDPLALAHRIVKHLSQMPDPETWDDVEPVWSAHDATPGKRYRLPNGGEAVAVKVGAGGELLCTVNGNPKTVLAADAIFGS